MRIEPIVFDGGCDRLCRHYLDGAQLILSVEADLLACLTAERMILKHAGSRAYLPTMNRIRGGITECFLPDKPVDLRAWVKRARASRAN